MSLFMTWHGIESASDVAARLAGRRFVVAEMMFKPRPAEPKHQSVFDFTLASRLDKLCRYENAAMVLICRDQATADSLAHLPTEYPTLLFVTAMANPKPIPPSTADAYALTPQQCGWETPERWRQYDLTDRWARLLFALDVGRQLTEGFLILPAHDAVWGRGLLARLEALSRRSARQGLDAAVSPYTYHQHSPVPGVSIDPAIIDAMNATFAPDSLLRWRFRLGRYQSFWGKMGMIPFGMCDVIRRNVQTMVWEDDLEIDRVIREAGYGARCLWIDQPSLYRQAPPVFDRDDLRNVIDRTLHYSLPIPSAEGTAPSLLNRPLDALGRLRCVLSPRFARAVRLSQTLISECNARIAARLDRYGASWVDWGDYRYVVTVGDPAVQVWNYEG